MPQTTALYEVTRSWYGSKPDTIRRGSDTDIAAALSIYWWPPVGSTLIGMQPPFKEEPMHSLPSPTSPSVAFSSVVFPGLFWN